MKPIFTDQHRFHRAYVRSEATDVAKTWAAVRKRTEQKPKQSDGNVLLLKPTAGART